MARLVPVDQMPQAPQKPRGARLVPVQAQPQTPSWDVRGPDGVPGLLTSLDTPAQPPQPQLGDLGPRRSLQYGIQSVGSGIANVAGFPVDILTLGLNAPIDAANYFGGLDLPRIENPVGGAQFFKDFGRSIAPTIDESEVPFSQRIAGDAVDFGTQGLLGGVAAARGMAPKAMQAPYRQNPVRAVGDDVAAGVGAGAGSGLYEEVTPEESQSPIGRLLSSLGGGLFGVTAGREFARTPGYVATGARKMVGRDFDPNVPADELTGIRPSQRTVDRAAAFVQNNASNPDLARRNLEEYVRELDTYQRADGVFDEGVSRRAQPTVGAMANDVGLAEMEKGARSRDAVPFIERDRMVQDRARANLNAIAPDGADPRAFTAGAEAERNALLSGIDQQTAAQRRQVESTAVPSMPVEQFQGQGADASRRIDERFRKTFETERARKNALYNDPRILGAPVDAEPLYAVAEDISRLRGPLDDPAAVPTDIVQRIRNLAEFDEETGDLIGFKPITYGDVQSLRASVGTELDAARAATGRGESGSGPRVQNLMRLRNVIDGYIDELDAMGGDVGARAAEAKTNFAENYGPRFKQGRAGDLSRAIKRDKTGTSTRPEDTAGKFLGAGKGDDAQSLMRAIPGDETAADAKTWLLDRMMQQGVVDQSGSIDGKRLAGWANRNIETIRNIPGMVEQVRDMARMAQDGTRIRQQVADRLAEIDAGANRQRDAINRGGLGVVSGRDPVKAVQAVFNSGDPENAMQDLVARLDSRPQAREGLKAAVRDHLVRKVTGAASGATTDGDGPVRFADLAKEFRDNERVLAKAFSPEEMNALRRVHKMLQPYGILATRGLKGGSDTAENLARQDRQGIMRAAEAGLKLTYGVLKGGGIFRSMNIALDSMPNREKAVDDLVRRMWFDPDLAMHLLGKDVKDKVGTPEYNRKLQLLIAGAAAGRESGEE